MRVQSTVRWWVRNLATAGLLVACGVLIVGCSSPDPNTAAGQAQIAGQKCTLCIMQNPGDGAPCYAICTQRLEDEAAYQKAYGRR